MLLFFYLFIGIFSGTLAGLIGSGGGIIMIPSLAWLFSAIGYPYKEILHYAAGTSFGAMILITATATVIYTRKKLVNWNWIRHIIPFLLIGLFLGVLCAHFLNTDLFRKAFSYTLLLIAFYLFCFDKKNKQVKPRLPELQTIFGSLSIGILSGLFGLSGGTFLIPLLLRSGLTLPHAIASSSVCILPISIVGTLIFMIQTPTQIPLNQPLIGYVNWLAALLIGIFALFFVKLGSLLAIRFKEIHVRGIVFIFLILTSLKMLYRF